MSLLDPLFLVRALPNAGLCGISLEFQVLGPNVNITNGTVSGLQAVATAAAAIRRGEVALAVAGGYDSLIRMDSIAEHLLAGRLATGQPGSVACRPFDAERAGLALGEGAAFVVLESASHAAARGATVYGELRGIAHTTDATAFPRTDPCDGRALEQAARQALRSSDGPAHPGAVFGDGLGTEADDLREANVFARLVEDGPTVYTASTGAFGFAGAASGVFSLIHALLALDAQAVPPLTSCRRLDPRCRLRPAAPGDRACLERALVWNSDHGLKNVAAVVDRRSAPDGARWSP